MDSVCGWLKRPRNQSRLKKKNRSRSRMNINPKPNYQIAPILNGKNVTELDPSAFKTRGSGAANIQIPARRERIIRVEINSNDRDFVKYPNFSCNIFVILIITLRVPKIQAS